MKETTRTKQAEHHAWDPTDEPWPFEREDHETDDRNEEWRDK